MNEAVDEIMIQAQVFASAWSLVGGRFDTGHCSDAAKEAKLELEKMVRAAIAAAPAQERIDALELEVRQLTEQIAELRHAPTPQADSQPAPVREGEWINDAGRIKWLMWRVQDLEAKLAARAPADSVLEDAYMLLQDVAACFTRDDDLPGNLLPRIDAALKARKQAEDCRRLVKS